MFHSSSFTFYALVFIIILIVLPVSEVASEDFSVDGYYKNFSLVSDSSEYESAIGSVNNKLRLNLFFNPSDWSSFNLSYSLTPRIQDSSLFKRSSEVFDIHRPEYRLIDFDSRFYPSEDGKVRSFGIFHNLDRAFVKLALDFADLYLGRQAISWGSARVFNPTDIIAPFTFDELDTEDKAGVDAVRIRVPSGFMGEFDTGYVFGEELEFEKSASFLRSKFYVLKTDVSVLFISFQENLLVGLDIARAFSGAGFWFEAAHSLVDVFDDYKANKENNYFRTTVGLDYSFSEKTYGFIEYHFSSAGAKRPENYLKELSKPAYTEGSVYLMGRHYLVPGITYQITPLITLNVKAILNLSDNSVFFLPELEYNIEQNIYVSAGVFVGIGREPVKSSDSSSYTRFHSEFGGYPDIYFSSFKIYF